MPRCVLEQQLDYRKEKTRVEQLTRIEECLKKIENYKKSTELKQKRTVANILIYGAALYVLACVIVFVWYLPESWLIRLGLIIPFTLIPFIIYGMKRLISNYFNSKMIKANKEYEDLLQKKKDIIDSIMAYETFNMAKEILSKYAPEKLRTWDASPAPLPQSQSKALVGPVACKPTLDNVSGFRKRVIENTSTTLGRSANTQMLAIQSSRLIPKSIFPRNHGFIDKLVEYMVGDGPSYRFALICKHCNGHNGMALQEEFPYMAYNCCYCQKYNPARNQRTSSPHLPDCDIPQASLPGIPEIEQDEQNEEKHSHNLSINSSPETSLENTINAHTGEVGGSEEVASESIGQTDTLTNNIVDDKLDDIPSTTDEPNYNENSQELGAAQATNSATSCCDEGDQKSTY